MRRLLSNLTVHLPDSSPSKFPGGKRQWQEGAEGDLWAGAGEELTPRTGRTQKSRTIKGRW